MIRSSWLYNNKLRNRNKRKYNNKGISDRRRNRSNVVN